MALVSTPSAPGDAALWLEGLQCYMRRCAELALLPLDDQILVLASKLLAPGGIPKEAEVDAVHVAVASICRCEYLLTWSLRHIANAQIRRTLERILKAYGYPVPTICTPETLF